MLKNKKIIDNLTDAQKASLLATGQLAPENDSADSGVPVLNITDLQNLNSIGGGIVYPSLSSAANSWNTELIGKISFELAARAKNKNIKAVVTPDFGVNTHVYKTGISEDPCLSGKIAAAAAKGISAAGVTPILADCSVSALDAEFMDSEVNKRVVRDYIVKPFEAALKESQSAAVMTSCTRLKGNLQDVNSSLISEALNFKKYLKINTVAKMTGGDSSVAGLNAGNLFLINGSAEELERAYSNYLHLKKALEDGKMTDDEFETACNGETVLTEEALYSGVDRFLDFASGCESHALTTGANINSAAADKTAVQASEEAVVLLKNAEKTLPLKKGARVAVVGQLASQPLSGGVLSFKEVFGKKEKLPFEFTGYAEGYRLNEERSDDLISSATTLAVSSDAVLLFLGFGKDREARIPDTRCLKLPANQLALLDALGKTKSKVIAVVSAGFTFDTSFDEDCDGLILLPLDGTFSHEALLKILTGTTNPSGKLTHTFYDKPDEKFLELKKNKDAGKIKIGPFFGYRGYDTEGVKVKYPFGYGLNYTSFSYSGIIANAGGVQFQIKNTGKRAGWEIAQAYIGMKKSDAVRPTKELKGFARVYLAPGQRKTVNIGFSYNDYAVYDPVDENQKVESGEYTVYVGASISDIRLEKSFNGQGHKLKEKKGSLSDYIQTQTNIVSGGYTMRVDDKYKKRGLFAGKNAAEVKRENETVISGQPSLEKLFLREFDVEADLKEETKETARSEEDVSAYIDKKLTMENAAIEFAAFMSERGIVLYPSSAREIISAFSASRMVILKSSDAQLTEEFIPYLCEYFGTPVFADTVADAVSEDLRGSDRLLFSRDGNGNYRETAVALALTAAAANKSLIHILTLGAVQFPEAEKYLEPLLRCAENPDKEHKILVKDKKISSKSYNIPANVWFVIIYENGDIPPQIAENAVIVDIKLRKVNEAEVKSPARPLNFYQFSKLVRDSEKTHTVSENMWRKLDKTEEFINSRTSYHIGNKEWRRMEKYTSVYLACEGTEAEAVDSVIAAKLLPGVLPFMRINTSDSFSDLSIALEKILGEENAVACRDTVKYFGTLAGISVKKEDSGN